MTEQTKNTCLWAIELSIARFKEHQEDIELQLELKQNINNEELIQIYKEYDEWINEMHKAKKEICLLFQKGIGL